LGLVKFGGECAELTTKYMTVYVTIYMTAYCLRVLTILNLISCSFVFSRSYCMQYDQLSLSVCLWRCALWRSGSVLGLKVVPSCS